MNIEAISADESLFQKLARHFEADPPEISGGSKGEVRQLINIEGEFGADVTVRALPIGHRVPILFSQLGKFESGGRIHSLRMTDGVAQVMRQGADREGILIECARVVKKPEDEIAGADVMS